MSETPEAKVTISQTNGTPSYDSMAVARRALFLAWREGKPFGMGRLRANPTASERDVWAAAYNADDYSRSPHKKATVEDEKTLVRADYVFGHMIKLHFTIDADSVTLRPAAALLDNGEFNPEYHCFAAKYKTPQALLDAALASCVGTAADEQEANEKSTGSPDAHGASYL
mgnify:FL=1